jgi:CRISPR-associated protein Csm5
VKRETIQSWQLRLHPLSPVHIGSGHTVEPYEYGLEWNGDACWLRMIDVDLRLSTLDEQQRKVFYQVQARGDLPGIRDWLRDAAKDGRFTKYRIPVEGTAARDLNRMHQSVNSTGEVHLMTRDLVTGRPFIPGSSVKGAIRTAVISSLASTAKDKTALKREAGFARNSSARLEAYVMGNTTDNGGPNLYKDPFRQFAVSDLQLSEMDCKIDRVRIVRGSEPTRGSTEKIMMFRDITFSSLDGDSGIAAIGQARFYPELQDKADLPGQLDVDRICRWCNDFYRPRLEAEVRAFVKSPDDADLLVTTSRDVQSNQCLIRLGRHSHFECVTIDPEFSTKPPRGVGRTRSYAGGTLPLGWAILTWSRA